MRLGVRDIASQFGVTEATVLRWAEEDGLPASKVDGQYRFSPAALFEWATARGMRVPASLFQEPENGDREVLPSVTEALRAGGVLEHIAGGDKRAVLGAMLEHLKLPRGTDREALLQILLAREQLGSTGIGAGIAIPHVRNPIVMRIPKPMLMLGLLEQPIDFGAVDSGPVHTLFLVVTPTTRSHLHLLSRLGYILRDQAVRDALVSRAPVSEILDKIQTLESQIPNAAKTG